MAFNPAQKLAFGLLGSSFKPPENLPRSDASAQKADSAVREALERMTDDERLALAMAQSQLASDPALMRKAQIESRNAKGGLFNLGATCWMNSLLQAVFKGNDIYLDQLRAQIELKGTIIREKRAHIEWLKAHKGHITMADVEAALLRSLDSTFDSSIQEKLDCLSLLNQPDETVQSVLDQKEDELKPLIKIQDLSTTLLEILDLSEREPSSEVNEALMGQIQHIIEILGEINPDYRNRQMDPNEALLTLLGPMGLNFIPERGAPLIPIIHRKTVLKATLSDSMSSMPSAEATQLNLSQRSAPSVQEGIRLEFMNLTTLKESERFNFEDGKGPQDTYKVDYLVEGDSFPKNLVVQVPRFSTQKTLVFDERIQQIRTELHGKKNNSNITFDEIIEIPLYNEEGTHVTRIIKMQLDSVITHRGHIDGGHYVAYKRDLDGNFILYNDAKKPSQVAAERAHITFQKEGYLALYKLVESSSIGPDQPTAFETIKFPSARINTPVDLGNEKDQMLDSSFQARPQAAAPASPPPAEMPPSQPLDPEDLPPSPATAYPEGGEFFTPISSRSSSVSSLSSGRLSVSSTTSSSIFSTNGREDNKPVKSELTLRIEAAYQNAVDPTGKISGKWGMPKSKKWVQINSPRNRFAQK